MRRVALALYLAATSFAQAPVAHVWGRISGVNTSGFEVDQNFNVDPQSAYRRGKRRIIVTVRTKFEGSAREDLQIGRTVDIIGLETTDSIVQATRIIVYEGKAPVQMPAGSRVVTPNGWVHVGK